MSRRTLPDKYLIPVALRTLDVLEAFHTPAETLTLEQVTARTAIPHTTAFRILHTLVSRGYLTIAGPGKRYRLNRAKRRAKIGFATLTHQTSFANLITEGLKKAAAEAGVELVLYNNERNAELAIENARALVASGVDLAIEFQRNEEVAPIIADIFTVAGLPTIAVVIPQPGAVYFGVNNYRAGLTAGHALADHARTCWNGRFDLLILLDLAAGGPVTQSRMTGVLRGCEERLGRIPPERVARIDSKGVGPGAAEATGSALAGHPEARRILVSAVNDESALAALAVLRDRGLAASSAIIGHGGSTEVWPEVADPDSPFLGTTYFFPEQYGPGLVSLALRILRGEPVAPFHYVPHELVHHGNVSKFGFTG